MGTTNRPTIFDGESHREMTKTEHEDWLQLVADIETQTAVIEARAAAKVSARAKLAALGLTGAEIAALVG